MSRRSRMCRASLLAAGLSRQHDLAYFAPVVSGVGPCPRVHDLLQRVGPVDLPRHAEHEPEIRVVGVRLADVLPDPDRDLVEFAIHVAESVVLQDRILGPGLRISGFALQIDAVSRLHELQERRVRDPQHAAHLALASCDGVPSGCQP